MYLHTDVIIQRYLVRPVMPPIYVIRQSRGLFWKMVELAYRDALVMKIELKPEGKEWKITVSKSSVKLL